MLSQNTPTELPMEVAVFYTCATSFSINFKYYSQETINTLLLVFSGI